MWSLANIAGLTAEGSDYRGNDRTGRSLADYIKLQSQAWSENKLVLTQLSR